MLSETLDAKPVWGIFVRSELTWTVPWGPHCGINYEFNARPRPVQVFVLCIPEALPIESFAASWGDMTHVEQTAHGRTL